MTSTTRVWTNPASSYCVNEYWSFPVPLNVFDNFHPLKPEVHLISSTQNVHNTLVYPYSSNQTIGFSKLSEHRYTRTTHKTNTPKLEYPPKKIFPFAFHFSFFSPFFFFPSFFSFLLFRFPNFCVITALYSSHFTIRATNVNRALNVLSPWSWNSTLPPVSFSTFAFSLLSIRNSTGESKCSTTSMKLPPSSRNGILLAKKR